MKAQLSHIGLLITSLEKAKEFYGNILGLKELTRPPFLIKGLWYEMGNFELHLMLYEQAERFGYHPLNETVQPHFALSMTPDEMAIVLRKLDDAGCSIIGEPRKSPGGVLQAFFYDPDFNMIEVNNEHHVTRLNTPQMV